MIHSQKQPQMEAVLVIGHFLWVRTTGPVTLQDIQGNSKVRQKKIACYPPEIIYLLEKWQFAMENHHFLINKSAYMCHVQPCETTGEKKKKNMQRNPTVWRHETTRSWCKPFRRGENGANWGHYCWMVYFMENPIKIDDSGAPPF